MGKIENGSFQLSEKDTAGLSETELNRTTEMKMSDLQNQKRMKQLRSAKSQQNQSDTKQKKVRVTKNLWELSK